MLKQNSNQIWIVDAFTDKPYGGNPAAIMIVEEFPEDISQIAMEMNLSETVFLKPLKDRVDHFHIRWLTPTVEVKLCGHGTLAASHILFQENLVEGNQIHFESLSGPLNVTKEFAPSSCLVLDFPLQPVSDQLEPQIYAEALGLSFEEQSRIIEVVRAYDDVIVVLDDPIFLRDLTPHIHKIEQIMDSLSVIVTARGGLREGCDSLYSKYDFVSRVFAPLDGIDEDPVTGSAHCKLADYWMKRLGKTQFFAYQASHRGGELSIHVHGNRVHLKGKAVTVMAGKWLV